MAQQRSGRGFAALPTSELRRISSAGGRASHESGHGHEWTSQEARQAGKRGGRVAQHNEQAPSQIVSDAAPSEALRESPANLDRGAEAGSDTQTNSRSN